MCLARAFTDGDASSQPSSPEWAEIFITRVMGLGLLFAEQRAGACEIVRNAGKDYEWLALVLERRTVRSKKPGARAAAVTPTPSRPPGWAGFQHAPGAAAQKPDAGAWKLHPGMPEAARRG